GCRERLTANGVEYELARLLLAHQLATRELCRQVAHPAALPEYPHAFALPELAVVEEALPGAEPGEGQRRTLHMGECARPGCERACRDRRIVGSHAVAVKRREREPLIAGGQIADTGSGL